MVYSLPIRHSHFSKQQYPERSPGPPYLFIHLETIELLRQSCRSHCEPIRLLRHQDLPALKPSCTHVYPRAIDVKTPSPSPQNPKGDCSLKRDGVPTLVAIILYGCQQWRCIKCILCRGSEPLPAAPILIEGETRAEK